MPRIPRIDIQSPRIRVLPRPVVRDIGPPVIRTIDPPVINVPNPIIEYPTIDVPTEQDFRQQMSPQRQIEEEETDEREMSTTPPTPVVTPPPPRPTINIGGIEAPLPEPAPLVTAGATAIVTTAVTLGATIVVSKIKDTLIEPLTKRIANPKKKKIKIKQVKPVLHFVLDEGGQVDVYEYTQKGTKLIDSTDDVEKYIRDQVEIDSLYEYDNKIIIDDVIKDKFTKEGAKRFKSLFTPAKSIAKKLGAKFSI
jgi:hypothetical protein